MMTEVDFFDLQNQQMDLRNTAIPLLDMLCSWRLQA